MNSASGKPRLLFFQYKYDGNLPAFLLVHKQEHVDCLSQFFDVTVIREDCDYRAVCDACEPDLALFESGVPFETCQRLVIRNVRANAGIPKLGFLHSDGFCEARAGFLSDMDHWGIETFFAIAVTAAEYNPAIADNLFVWPNFVNDSTYRDYGQWKNIPVLFTGNTNTLYPWRKKIVKLVANHYPSLICPHPGYSPRKAQRQVTIGEPYARMLNASCFVPACGTAAREVVRKHFEVPACRSCLVTEKSAGLEAAGFVDMVNCVFADEHDVLDKLAYLFDRPERLQAITDAGYELVHSCHTWRQRNQVRQWFELHRCLKGTEKIVQPNPFAPLRALPRSEPSSYFKAGGSHLILLNEGDRELAKSNYEEAERFYLRCLYHYRFMPEPQLRLALCRLRKGDPAAALSWIGKPLQFTLTEYKSPDPDPVEWAYFIVALLCAGNLKDAAARAAQFPSLRHIELDRARMITAALTNSAVIAPTADGAPPFRRSIHRVPDRSIEAWTREICAMLEACRQRSFAATLESWLVRGLPLSHSERRREIKNLETLDPASQAAVNGFRKRHVYSQWKAAARGTLARFLHGMEAKLGYFLPYHLSSAKNDEFFAAVNSLARDEDVTTILAIGLRPKEAITRALLAGVSGRYRRLLLYFISPQLEPAASQPANEDVHWREVAPDSAERVLLEIESIAGEVSPRQGTASFDALLIDLSAWKPEAAITQVLRTATILSRRIFLTGIKSSCNQLAYFELLEDPRYRLVDQDLELRHGHAIFEREPHAEPLISDNEAALLVRDSS